MRKMRNRGLMQHPHRISIVGATGSGKSFLARQLADRLGLPAHELDEIRSECGTSNDAFRTKVDRIIATPKWIIDGHYRDVREMIWDQADTIVWLDFPLSVIGPRLVRRFIRKKLRTESDPRPKQERTAEEPPSASWSHRLSRFRRTASERRDYAVWLERPRQRGITIIELRSPAAAATWIESLPPSPGFAGRAESTPAT